MKTSHETRKSQVSTQTKSKASPMPESPASPDSSVHSGGYASVFDRSGTALSVQEAVSASDVLHRRLRTLRKRLAKIEISEQILVASTRKSGSYESSGSRRHPSKTPTSFGAVTSGGGAENRFTQGKAGTDVSNEADPNASLPLNIDQLRALEKKETVMELITELDHLFGLVQQWEKLHPSSLKKTNGSSSTGQSMSAHKKTNAVSEKKMTAIKSDVRHEMMQLWIGLSRLELLASHQSMSYLCPLTGLSESDIESCLTFCTVLLSMIENTQEGEFESDSMIQLIDWMSKSDALEEEPSLSGSEEETLESAKNPMYSMLPPYKFVRYCVRKVLAVPKAALEAPTTRGSSVTQPSRPTRSLKSEQPSEAGSFSPFEAPSAADPSMKPNAARRDSKESQKPLSLRRSSKKQEPVMNKEDSNQQPTLSTVSKGTTRVETRKMPSNVKPPTFDKPLTTDQGSHGSLPAGVFSQQPQPQSSQSQPQPQQSQSSQPQPQSQPHPFGSFQMADSAVLRAGPSHSVPSPAASSQPAHVGSATVFSSKALNNNVLKSPLDDTQRQQTVPSSSAHRMSVDEERNRMESPVMNIGEAARFAAGRRRRSSVTAGFAKVQTTNPNASSSSYRKEGSKDAMVPDMAEWNNDENGSISNGSISNEFVASSKSESMERAASATWTKGAAATTVRRNHYSKSLKYDQPPSHLSKTLKLNLCEQDPVLAKGHSSAGAYGGSSKPHPARLSHPFQPAHRATTFSSSSSSSSRVSVTSSSS